MPNTATLVPAKILIKEIADCIDRILVPPVLREFR